MTMRAIATQPTRTTTMFIKTTALLAATLLLLLPVVQSLSSHAAFVSSSSSPSLFGTTPPTPTSPVTTTNPFQKEGLDLELPDFTKLFDKIQQVSPLARQVISGEAMRGLMKIPSEQDKDLPWKVVERKPSATVHQIDKLDQFDGRSTPIFRFRASLKGPVIGEWFGKYIIDLEERRKWDDQIEQIREVHPVNDLDSANIAMGYGQYGDCSRLGIGYGQTKKSPLGITPREQLFLYGLQDFQCGSCLIWGTELDDKSHDHLLPPGKRHTRAKSHLFSATLTPTGNDTFDVEYVLQMDIGGNIPKWLTTPVLIDTVKNLFNVAADEFAQGMDHMIAEFWKQHKKEEQLADKQLLLMAP